MGVKKIGELVLDDLIASGRVALLTKTVLLAEGNGDLKRGQLIGYDNASGSYNPMEAPSSGTPVGILCADVDNLTDPAPVEVYVSGHFNGNKIIGYTSEYYDTLRNCGIFVDTAFEY